MKCEVIEIEGGRKLYNYTFEIAPDDERPKDAEAAGNLTPDMPETSE